MPCAAGISGMCQIDADFGVVAKLLGHGDEELVKVRHVEAGARGARF